MTMATSIPSLALMLLVLLGILIIGLDIWKKTPGLRWVRILCTTTLLSAIYALISPLYYSYTPEKKRIIINTSRSDVPDSLLGNNTVIFEDYLQWLKSEKSWITDTLLIVGKGLESWEISGIKQPFGYVPAPVPEGIINLHTGPLFENTPNIIAGELFLNQDIDLSVRLPDGSLKTQTISEGASNFEFTVSIPVQGNQLLELIGVRGQDTIFEEYYPIFINPEPEIKTLLLTGFPTFEQKGLVENMAQLGYSVISHQMLGAELYKTNFYNQASTNSFRMTSKLVKELSLLVVDPAGFKTLPTDLFRTIKKQVQMGALGLIWLGEPQDIEKPFEIRTLESANELLLKTDQGEFQLNPFNRRIQGTPLKVGPSVIARAANYGFGFITQPSASNTYLLSLQGQDSIYRKIWHSILSSSTGFQSTSREIKKDPFATVNRRSTLQIKSSTDQAFLLEGKPLLPLESVLKPEWLSVDYFPITEGWQPLFRSDTLLDQIYHAALNSWEARNSYRSQIITQHASLRSQQFASPEVDFRKPIDNWWWYGVMLLSLAILWFEHRLRS